MVGFFLLVIVAGGAHASPRLAAVSVTKCDFSFFSLIQPPCTPTLGGTVYIKLMDNATGYVLAFSKKVQGKDVKLFIVKDGKVKIRHEYRNRTKFSISTGTLKLADVERDDEGQYNLQVYTPLPNPMFVESLSFNLQIEENHPFSGRISVSAELGAILIVLIICCVIWKLKPWRKSGYQRLRSSG